MLAAYGWLPGHFDLGESGASRRVMVSSIGSSSTWFSMPSWSPADLTASQDVSDLFADSATDLITAFSTAASNQLSGTVNLTAAAAAKRLGITLPSSSSSTTPNPAATATKTTSTAPAPTSSFTNIDQLLAQLDGNPFIPPPSTSSGTTTPFRMESFLGSLDNITSGQSASAPTTPTGASFSVASYLKSLDAITQRPLTIVNVTA
jgi:hypothetical protein